MSDPTSPPDAPTPAPEAPASDATAAEPAASPEELGASAFAPETQDAPSVESPEPAPQVAEVQPPSPEPPRLSVPQPIAPDPVPAAPPPVPQPASAPPVPRLARGVGVLSGFVSGLGIGVTEAVVAVLRSPPGSMPARTIPFLIGHCVAIVLGVGVLAGALEELLLASWTRNKVMHALARFVTDGPRRWFRADPELTTGLALTALGLTVTFAPLFPGSYWIIHSFHSQFLSALAISLLAGGSAAVALLLASALGAPLRWFFGKARFLARPGLLALVALLACVAETIRFAGLHWATLRNLDGSAAAVAGAFLGSNLLALCLGAAIQRRRRRPLSWRPLVLAGALPLLLLALSGFTFGRRQVVASAVFQRTVLAGYIARGLQLTIDLDRDGYSALFGGGDCNDRDPRIHPGADDIPGNGIDENCSGRDAHVDREESDGRLTPLPPTLPQVQPSFLLLSVDAMRPDHMSGMGYRRRTTPNLDAFAREGAVFRHAYCGSPRSLRSFASIWTGRYPSLVSWGSDYQYPPLNDDNVTLAELLAQANYRTASFSGALYFSRTQGFYQGFAEHYEGEAFKSDGEPTIQQLRGWLRVRDVDPRPFFVWSHLMEAHDPYIDRTTPQDFGHEQMDQYDEDLARADELFGMVLSDVRAMATRRPIYVVLFGDHGEAFGEHGVYHHSFDLHEEAMRVPLIVWGPGITPGPRDALTSLFDLHPTILNLARLQPGAPVTGLSLARHLFTPGPGTVTASDWRDHLYGEVTPDGRFPFESKCLYAWPYKILYDLRRGTWELYDVVRDPGELRNLYDEQPAVATALRERLLAWIENATLPQNRSSEMISAARLPQVPHMQYLMHARFGDVFELLGFDFPQTTVSQWGVLRLTLYLRVLRRTRYPVELDVHFEATDGGPPLYDYFRARHHPIYGRYRTTEWNVGEILRDEINILVDPAVRQGRARVRLAAVIEGSDNRLTVSDRPSRDNGIDLVDFVLTPP